LRRTVGYLAFLEGDEIVSRRRALAFGDSLKDGRLWNAPEIAGHRRLPPLRHVERHGGGKLIGVIAQWDDEARRRSSAEPSGSCGPSFMYASLPVQAQIPSPNFLYAACANAAVSK
jgi:hypothetical protein